MKKFLNNRRVPDGLQSPPDGHNNSSATSPPPPSPGIKKTSTSRWKKTAKKQPEPKPELNIEAALPASDDFRTSLLMPNLSARFSMLREQDDPNSLLGKASDDSVLQPRRRSRMLDFGFGSNGLNDIAEVQSISGSVKPPFAAVSRQDSYASEEGYGSESEALHAGGMMGRSRPGEGNVLFGGRQKVYKIPATGAVSTKSLGKAVYEDDIGVSAFQRFKQREKEEAEAGVQIRACEDNMGFDFGLDQTDSGDGDGEDTPSALNDSAKDLSHSPSPSSYDKNRSTTSSVTRSEARSSTAATSITSQPAVSAPSPLVTAIQPTVQQTPSPSMPMLKRADTKTRRLYEQGLDQHIQEQQTSNLTRLNSIQRQRAPNHMKSAPYLPSVKSANNIHNRIPQPVYALRAQSPPPLAQLSPLSTFGSIRNPHSNGASPLISRPQSPVSPQGEYFDEASVLTQMLEPGDRGKATAMGAFEKPKGFNEDQYLERQKQLQRSQSNASVRRDPRAPSALSQRLGRLEQADRQRSTSNASTRSRSRSAPKGNEPSKAYNVFQNAATQIAARSGVQQYDTHRTFFGNISASDSEEEEDDESRYQPQYSHSDYGYQAPPGRWQPTALPSVSEHPALRSKMSRASLAEDPAEYEEESMPPPVSEHPALRSMPSQPSLAEDPEEDGEEEYEDLQPLPLRPVPSSQSLRGVAFQAEPVESGAIDSPTLGPRNAQPLTGMVHHLRQQSNASSVYPNDDLPEDVPEVPEVPSNARSLSQIHIPIRNTLDSDQRIESTYTSSNPWDLDDVDNAYDGADAADSPISPIDGARRQFGSRAPSRATMQDRQSVQDRQSAISQDSESVNGSGWQSAVRKQHTRDASTATQQERDAFANELAARRTAIQENMKSIVETQSRNVSPAPSASGARKAFGMLRSKSSRESVDMPRQPSGPTKAMKMLGIGSGMGASSSTLHSQHDRTGFSMDGGRSRASSISRSRSDNGTRSRDNSDSRPPPLPTAQPWAPPLNDWEQARARAESEASKTDRPQITSPHAPSQTNNRARSRSNSEVTTGRSRSRTGPYRDDLERAMVEGMGSRAAGHPELSPMLPLELTPRPSPEMPKTQFDAGQNPQARARSHSRPAVPSNYFDSKNLQPIQTGPPPTTRLAPGTLSPNVYTPNGVPTSLSARTSPAVSPMIQNPTPPLSGANTPLAPTFTPPPAPTPRSGPLRRKTVSKADISEPTLLSATSTFDTIDLPEGASLKNGMDQVSPFPPPVPHINPKRRVARKMFGLGGGRGGLNANVGEEDRHNFGRSKTPDPWTSREPEKDFVFDLARQGRSKTEVGGAGVGRVAGVRQGYEKLSAPALSQQPSQQQQHGFGYAAAAGSPERVQRSPLPQPSGGVEGGMF